MTHAQSSHLTSVFWPRGSVVPVIDWKIGHSKGFRKQIYETFCPGFSFLRLKNLPRVFQMWATISMPRRRPNSMIVVPTSKSKLGALLFVCYLWKCPYHTGRYIRFYKRAKIGIKFQVLIKCINSSIYICDNLFPILLQCNRGQSNNRQ